MPALDGRRLTTKNALIVVQVAVSVLLLGGTSIFLQQLAATRERRVGYAVDGVAMIETDALHRPPGGRGRERVRGAAGADRRRPGSAVGSAVVRPPDGEHERGDRRRGRGERHEVGR
ncbi:MAG: hypothetical protein ABW221_25255 [Vicinamibacteria bacterium]